jgi:hypothetical protein
MSTSALPPPQPPLQVQNEDCIEATLAPSIAPSPQSELEISITSCPDAPRDPFTPIPKEENISIHSLSLSTSAPHVGGTLGPAPAADLPSEPSTFAAEPQQEVPQEMTIISPQESPSESENASRLEALVNHKELNATPATDSKPSTQEEAAPSLPIRDNVTTENEGLRHRNGRVDLSAKDVTESPMPSVCTCCSLPKLWLRSLSM